VIKGIIFHREWIEASQFDAYQAATGTVVVRDPVQITPQTGRIALYVRVSSAD
jgi:putative resolvase